MILATSVNIAYKKQKIFLDISQVIISHDIVINRSAAPLSVNLPKNFHVKARADAEEDVSFRTYSITTLLPFRLFSDGIKIIGHECSLSLISPDREAYSKVI